MNLPDFLRMMLAYLTGYGIPLIFWIAVLISGVIIMRKGGGKPERYVITGASLGILTAILRIPLALLPYWVLSRGANIDTYRVLNFAAGLFVDIIGATGIMFLIWAFWLKFNSDNSNPVVHAKTG